MEKSVKIQGVTVRKLTAKKLECILPPGMNGVQYAKWQSKNRNTALESLECETTKTEPPTCVPGGAR